MEFITDIKNVHKDDIQYKLYRAWKHIQAKLSKGNKRHQENLTICKSWYYFSNFLEDISQLDNYIKFTKNPQKFKLQLKDNVTHYNKYNVYFKELLIPTTNAYPVSSEEYYKIYNNYQIKYCRYRDYISIIDYNELINYSIGCAAISYKNDKGAIFITFANRVVHNRILDYIRDNKKHLGLKYLEEQLYNDGDPTTLQDMLICNKDTINTTLLVEMLKEYIATLPELEATILKLLIQGYNQKEISKMLNVYPSRVSRIYNKIKARIKGWI